MHCGHEQREVCRISIRFVARAYEMNPGRYDTFDYDNDNDNDKDCIRCLVYF
jgi:hypothetical protein